ncbi:phage tail protein [Dyella tabacisoli]|uniref:Microcystin-dependent protein n=1 Tax=Dyella tabacisoli TaxID=2282381 RepID=A0A369UJX5_9GAMM|nr:tail fiber protein [Dyella tabacisoli]RDD81072.1 microcystin-dependent protein [Dyella tabacisoli]
MSNFYLGQIMLTGFGFAQKGFALCNGQALAINQNAALFALLGTSYGGNGQTTFMLPNMQGVTPVGAGIPAGGGGASYTYGQTGGTETVTLLQSNLPQHTHQVMASTQAGTVKNPNNAVYGSSTSADALYGAASSGLVALNPAEILPTGGSGPHDNMQPYLVINFNIALVGIFPSRN